MRNLKRALSLTLASVMLLGMMVVGTSAASYPDVTEEHNVEAIEVLQAVGVMSGSDSGNFNPDSQVSRIEMAVVMSNLLNLKVDYFENQCRFTDVPAWAGKYVAACEASGIVSGIGNNQFGVGNVTATQAALMMLKALGYFQYASDFAGGWEQETAKLTANLGLFKGLSNVYNTTELTRNQVAQLALNTLKTPVVVPEDNTLTVSGQGSGVDFTINGGKVNYKITASSDAYAKAISAVEGSDQSTINGIRGYVIELGEKLYDGKLQLRENGRIFDGLRENVYDDFGRPSRRWQYDGIVFGTYPKTEELRKEYTVKVTGKELYDLLGADLIKQYDVKVTIDGETTKAVLGDAYFSELSMIRTNTDKVGDTGNGVLTQVYIDSVNHQLNIAIINTYLAQADQDYNSKDNDVDLNIYCIEDKGSAHYVKSDRKDQKEEIITANGEDFPITEVKEDDFFLVTVADGKIQSMVAPEIVSETTLNSFKKDNWVKNDDAQYDYATTAQYDPEVLDEYDQTNMKDVTYDVILDKYGYLIGLELNEEINQYAFLTGIDLGESNLSKKNAQANIIMLDGTMQTVTVNIDKSEYAAKPVGTSGGHAKNYTVTGGGEDLGDIRSYVSTDNTGATSFAQVNTWCTYSVDANGVYTLKQVGSYSTARKDPDTHGGTVTDPVKGAKKIAQSYIDVADLAGTADVDKGNVIINNKNTSLIGSDHALATKPGSVKGDFNYVYGNNETVYINTSLKSIDPRGGGATEAIVNKVDSVTTGIANVDFTVEDIANSAKADGAARFPQCEIYALYKDNGYLIGVVILGGVDNGASSHYVYITDDVSQEDYQGNSEWQWYREAIVDGKKVLLTEVADGMDYLKKMETGRWYNVTYDKNGHVNGIKNENTGTSQSVGYWIDFYYGTDKYVTEVEDIRLATNGLNGTLNGGTRPDFTTKKSDTVLLYKDYRCSTHSVGASRGNGTAWLMVENDTLYVDQGKSQSIRISPDTKTVLITSKQHNNKLFNDVYDGYEGADGLDRALRDLNSETRNGFRVMDGILTAICDKGVAKVIILNDQSGNGKGAPVEIGKPMTINVTLNGANGTLHTTINWYGGDDFTCDNASLAAEFPEYDITGSSKILASAFREGESMDITFNYAPKSSSYNGKITFGFDASTGTPAVGTRAKIDKITYTGANAPTLNEAVAALVKYMNSAYGCTLDTTEVGVDHTGDTPAGPDESKYLVMTFKTAQNVPYVVLMPSQQNGSNGTYDNALNAKATLSGTPSPEDVTNAVSKDQVVIESGANVELDATQAGQLTGGKNFEVKSGATVTVKGGTVNAPVTGSGTVAVNEGATVAEVAGAATVNVDAGTVTTVSGAATVNVDAGTVTTVSGAATVNVNNGGSVATVNNANAVVNTAGTQEVQITTVTAAKSITANAAKTTISGNVGAVKIDAQKDVKVGGTIAAEATINMAKGSTVELANVTTLPKITGEGTLKLTGTNSGGTIEELAQKLGDAKADVDASKAGTATINRNGVAIDKSSTAVLNAFSSRPLNEEINAKHAKASLYNFTVKGIPAGATVGAIATYKGEADGTDPFTSFKNEGDSAVNENFVLLLGDQIAKVTFKVTVPAAEQDGEATVYTIVYTIKD